MTLLRFSNFMSLYNSASCKRRNGDDKSAFHYFKWDSSEFNCCVLRQRGIAAWRMLVLWLVIAASAAVLCNTADAAVEQTSGDRIRLEPRERQWLTEHDGKIRIGITVIPPQILANGTAYKGLSIDYINLLERKLGVRFKLVPYATWDQVIQAAKERRIDMIFAAQQTPERLQYLLFTEPYIELPNIIIVRRDHAGGADLSEMKGWSVATSKGSAVQEYLKDKFPGLVLRPVADELAGLRMVSLGEADAMVVEISRASYYIEKAGILNLRVAGDAGLLYQLRFAVRKDWPELRTILDRALATVTGKERREISRRWIIMGKRSIFASKAVLNGLLIALGVVAVILIGAFSWNRALRRVVRQRTEQLQLELAERKRAEDALRHERSLLAQITETSPIGITMVNRDGQVTFANRQAENMLGLTKDAITQRTYNAPQWRITDFDGGYFPDNKLPFRQVMALRRPVFDIRHAIEWPDGRRICLSINGAPLRNDAGEVESVVFALVDVTERSWSERALRESEQKYRQIFDNASDVMYLLEVAADGRFRIIDINQALVHLTGISLEQTVNKFLDEISPLDVSRALVRLSLRCVETGAMVIDESEFDLPVGPRTFLSSFIPLRDSQGRIYRIVVISRDTTERKRAEEKIRNLYQELEQRVTDRTAKLAEANKELEDISYSVSHDLRTPLRAIDGFSHIVLEDYADKLDDEGKRMLQVVRDNTSRMGRLIDNILEFLRIYRQELRPYTIDMEELAHSVVDELRPVGGKMQIEIDPLPPCIGDRAMLRQIWANLLSNSIKFSRNGKPPIIKVGATVKDGETIYYVKDNGVGFDMQYADKLFGVFQRLHSVTEFEGTGIGLAIVKRIVIRHGGRIWAEGKVNKGATVYFTLPSRENMHE